MSQHTSPSRQPKINRRSLPRGRTGLLALEVALQLATRIHSLGLPRRLTHLGDHLQRAADNTALRLSEASGRTMGNRYQHLEAAYAENQEVQSDLLLLSMRDVDIAPSIIDQAHRLGGLIYGLLRAKVRGRQG